MDAFLAASRKCLANLSEYSKIRVILGNPTCDLDSAVCALAQGYLEYREIESCGLESGVIPVLNVNKREFRVKTEVVYHLKHCNVPIDLLTFRDELDLHELHGRGRLELVLVDHHVLPREDVGLAEAVLEVFDHRPQDPNWLWPDRKFTLGQVGSCATLVTQNIVQRRPELLADLACLLQGPMLIDTANFSEEAGKATPLDREMMARLGRISARADTNGPDELYRMLQDAKSDVGQLTPADLLIKDLKVVNGVPIPGFPVLVKDFLALDGAAEALETFCAEQQCRVLVLMGREWKEDRLTRDLAVYHSLGADRAANKLIEALTGSTEPSLQLTPVKSWLGSAGGARLYEQANVQATRKQILPIVQSASSTDC
ncbi:exopolyphosphatase PRUNE1 [Copidosoma floridanum]|uniref:exopolyphosphatase PRUNE1 n=1 Tax=Copidosoma floridanum TaxID=29053 RepID=UPI0006C9DCAD|nr:exopolyphosphatase PRUNE1 [Copidosoma floridanum]